uniref:Carboxylic ester hydrolase n=1 Tax=Rhabditophanes sp. KR3021 TaxID=114890 RepID=A0AC35TWI9_9BILA
MLLLKSLLILLLSREVYLNAGPRVKTPFGEYEGFEYGEANVFLGIRYADVPGGNRRFEKPSIVKKETGLINATAYGPSCYPWHRAGQFSKTMQYSEDCLFMNIMTPKIQSDQLFDVAVMIHGGGFDFGNAADLGYKKLCDSLVKEGIVVVTIQYRVGFLGFLTTSDHTVPGNMGLWDATYSLYLIDSIIEHFGGAQDKITIMGHSAGAALAGALTLSPHSNYLFQRSIQMSGSIFNDFGISTTADTYSKILAEKAGCSDKDSKVTIQCLKEKTIDELYDAMDQVEHLRKTYSGFMFTPRHDGDFFPAKLESMIKKAQPKPTLVGLTEYESSFILYYPAMKRLATLSAEEIATFDKHALETYIAERILPHEETGRSGSAFRHHLFEFFVDRDAPTDRAPFEIKNKFYLERLTQLTSDIFINIGVYHEMEMKRINEWPVYFYNLQYASPFLQETLPIKGATHCSEFIYFFNRFVLPEEKWTDKDKNAEKTLIDGFVHFIKNGSPSSPSQVWPKISASEPSIHLNIDGEGNSIKESYKPDNINFWNKELPQKIGTGILTKTRIPSADLHKLHIEQEHTEL